MGRMFRFMGLGCRVSLGGQHPVSVGGLGAAWRQVSHLVCRLLGTVLEQGNSTRYEAGSTSLAGAGI